MDELRSSYGHRNRQEIEIGNDIRHIDHENVEFGRGSLAEICNDLR